MNQQTYCGTFRPGAIVPTALGYLAVASVWLAVPGTVGAADTPINPYPRIVIDQSTIAMVDFSRNAHADHWQARTDCTVRIVNGCKVGR